MGDLQKIIVNMEITIIYSSGGGNTKLVVDKVAEILWASWHSCTLINVLVAQPEHFENNELTILAAPTYDHGILHKPFEVLLDQADKVHLNGNKFAIIWLGDNKYDAQYHIESATILMEWVQDHDWEILGDGLLINKSPVGQLDTTVTAWADALLSHLN